MELGASVVALVAGLLIGVVLTAAFLRRARALAVEAALAAHGAETQVRLATSEARLVERDGAVVQLQQRLDAALAESRAAAIASTDSRIVAAGLAAELREERERAGEKLAVLAQARDDLSAHFKLLAGDVLETNRARMAEQHHGALENILKPLGEKIMAFEKKVEDTYDKEAQQRSSLRQEVLNLQQATARINEDAANLTRALKGESKTRGNWGEVVLERVLERSGLVKGVEYVIQQSLKDDDGANLRPDVVVHLPDNKHVVIDSKVSLVAYDRYYAAVDEEARSTAGKEHVDSMRRHAKSLGAKSYQRREGLDTPDFVAMFVPIEPAYGLASSLDGGLFLDAWDRQVVIVTPSTLLALLMTVQTLWQREKQTRNAIEIAEQSGALHDQFVRVVESLRELDKHLTRSQQFLKKAEDQLIDGRGNLVGRIDRLREMGAKTKKDMPAAVLARAVGRDDADGDDGGDDGEPPAATSRLVLVPDLDAGPL